MKTRKGEAKKLANRVFAQMLNAKWQESGLSQNRFCKHIGVTLPFLSFLFGHERGISLWRAVDVANRTEIDLGELQILVAQAGEADKPDDRQAELPEVSGESN